MVLIRGRLALFLLLIPIIVGSCTASTTTSIIDDFSTPTVLATPTATPVPTPTRTPRPTQPEVEERILAILDSLPPKRSVPEHAEMIQELTGDGAEPERVALEIERIVRCPICDLETTIAEGDFSFPQQMRQLIREKLEAGESIQTVLELFVDAYGATVVLVGSESNEDRLHMLSARLYCPDCVPRVPLLEALETAGPSRDELTQLTRSMVEDMSEMMLSSAPYEEVLRTLVDRYGDSILGS